MLDFYVGAIQCNSMTIKLLIGIGNPDEEYQNTRHNIGFMFVDYVAKKLGADEFSAGGGSAFGGNKKLKDRKSVV